MVQRVFFSPRQGGKANASHSTGGWSLAVLTASCHHQQHLDLTSAPLMAKLLGCRNRLGLRVSGLGFRV